LFWIRFATVSLPGLTSIPLALLGYGYWSLVIGTLAGQLFQTTLLWILSPWRPTLLIEVDIAKDIMRFGFWVTLSALLMWFFVWADIFVVGYFLGPHELGIYRTGNHFVIMTYALVFSPVLPVLYSYLSRAQYRPDLIRRCAFIAVSWISIISMPIAAFLFGFSDQLSQIIFGSVWNGIALVIGIMGVVHGISWLAGMNGEFYRAIGRPELETVINSMILVIYLLVYWFTIQYGLINFLYGRVALSVFSVILHLILFDRILGLGFKIVFARLLPILVISLFMLMLALLILRYFTDSVLWSLLFGVGNLLFTLGLVLLLYKKNIVTEYRDLKLLT
jgi:PST family polysaccharide transporter